VSGLSTKDTEGTDPIHSAWIISADEHTHTWHAEDTHSCGYRCQLGVNHSTVTGQLGWGHHVIQGPGEDGLDMGACRVLWVQRLDHHRHHPGLLHISRLQGSEQCQVASDIW